MFGYFELAFEFLVLFTILLLELELDVFDFFVEEFDYALEFLDLLGVHEALVEVGGLDHLGHGDD